MFIRIPNEEQVHQLLEHNSLEWEVEDKRSGGVSPPLRDTDFIGTMLSLGYREGRMTNPFSLAVLGVCLLLLLLVHHPQHFPFALLGRRQDRPLPTE